MHGTQQRKEWFFPTAFSHWGGEEQAALQRVIASGRFTMGEQTEAFEAEFAAYHQMKYGIAVNSGSSANLIMVAALFNLEMRPPLERGDVLVPALAWGTTYAPLVQHGLQLQLMDCDDTWCFQEKYSGTARLAVGAAILGVPAARMDSLQTTMTARGGYLLEDNCEGLGAQYMGRLAGTRGLMNSFSFFYSHQLSAVEGGMILTNDDECARLCRILRDHGNTRAVDPPTTFEKEYNFTHFGYNVRPIEMHSAVARVQLRKLEGFIYSRRENLRKFVELTQGFPIRHQATNGAVISPFGMAFTVASTEVRSRLVTALRAEGIDCRLPTGGSFTRHPYGRRWAQDCYTPNADFIHEAGLFIGNAPFPIIEQVERAAAVLHEVLA